MTYSLVIPKFSHAYGPAKKPQAKTCQMYFTAASVLIHTSSFTQEFHMPGILICLDQLACKD